MFKSISKSAVYVASQVQGIAMLSDPAIASLARAAITMEIASSKMMNESFKESGMSLQDLLDERQAIRNGSLQAQAPKLVPTKAA